MLDNDITTLSCVLKIQKIWRGYSSRKNVFDFYRRKKEFQEMEWKAELIR